MHRDRSAFRIRDAFVHRERCSFAVATQLDRVLNREIPRMVEIEIAPCARKASRIGESGARIVRGVACNRQRLIDGVANGVEPEIGGAGVPPSLADIDRYTDPFVAIVGDGFNLALAHGYALSERLRDLGFRGRRAACPGLTQHAFRDPAQRFRSERKPSGKSGRQSDWGKSAKGNQL